MAAWSDHSDTQTEGRTPRLSLSLLLQYLALIRKSPST